MTLSESDNNKKSIGDTSDLYKSALSSIVDGVVITDINGTIIWINRAYENITGYSLDELVNKNFSILKSEKHDRKSTRLNSSHVALYRMPSSA